MTFVLFRAPCFKTDTIFITEAPSSFTCPLTMIVEILTVTHVNKCAHFFILISSLIISI